MGSDSSNVEVFQQCWFLDEVIVAIGVAVTGPAVDDDWVHVVRLYVENVLGIVVSVMACPAFQSFLSCGDDG